MTRNTEQPISALAPAPIAARYKGVQATSRYLTMRDGVQIAIDIMLPQGLQPGARLPVVMIMARYWRSMELRMPDPPNKALIGPRADIAEYLLARGFAIIVVDARGAGASTGIHHHPWSPEELADYGEVASWAADQSWCNGNIGAVGISYEGSTAQYLLTTGVKNVKSVVPMEYEFDVYTDVAFPGGIFNAAFIQAWNESNRRLDSNQTSRLFPFPARLLIKGVRPVDTDRKARKVLNQALNDHHANTDVHAALSQITYRDDPFGNTGVTLDNFSVFTHRAAIEASQGAMMAWGSWLDGATADTVLRAFNTLQNPMIGVIGAWKHEMSAHASPYHKPQTQPNPLLKQQWDAVAGFFDQTLAKSRPLDGKRLFYYTLGEEAWKQTDTFPLPNTLEQTWHFQPQRGLSTQKPNVAGAENYEVDFEATTGVNNRWHTQMAQPVVYADRANADRRLLTFTSEPLDQDMTITGYPVVTLHVASDEADCAFFVYLEDVDARGMVRYLTEGQLRSIHRNLSDSPAPYWTGMPYRTFKRADAAPLPHCEFVELTFGLQPVSALLRRGHRIRVAIAGADKDTFQRVPAQKTPVWHIGYGQVHSSHVRLPVIT